MIIEKLFEVGHRCPGKNLVVQQIEIAAEKGWYGCCEFDNLNFVQYTKRNTAIKKAVFL